jgi:aspartate aminotransferase
MDQAETQKISELSSLFDGIDVAPSDPIIEILDLYSKCPNPEKVNLTIGAYRNEKLQPIVFNSVKIAEEEILKENFSREYLPFLGDQEFNSLTQTTLFDLNNPKIKQNKKLNVIDSKRIVTVQSISGSGSLRLGAEFLSKFIHKKVYIPHLTWTNHFLIFEKSGMETIKYPYFNSENKELDFENLKNFLLNSTEENSVVLLHVCGHNPTGVDPNESQWRDICEIMKQKNLFPFFDLAYQGYISGDLYADIYPIYIFLENDFEMFISQSFSKSMNLYGERAGSLHVIINPSETLDENIKNIKIHFTQIAKGIYLVPVGHGSRIIKRVLGKEHLRKMWENELKECVHRLNYVRSKLYEELKRIETKGTWEHVINQKGMFSYTGLNENQCCVLIEKHNIFLSKSGRISLSGLNDDNIQIVALAIKDAVENY